MKNDDKNDLQFHNTDINEQLISHLRNINHTMHSLYEGKGSQKRILIMLNKTGTITQRELTEKLGIKPSSASEVIAKLESAKLIIRTPSKTDKRTADVILTQLGKEKALEASKLRQQRHQDMFSCLTIEEKKQLLHLFEKINDNWEKYQSIRKRHHHQ